MLVAGVGYFPAPVAWSRIYYKTAAPLVLLLITMLLGRKEAFRPYQHLFRALFAVSLGIWMAWLLDDLVTQMWDLSVQTPAGMAVAKLIEVIPIIATILFVNRLSGHNLGWLYLRKGKIWHSLGLGFLASILLVIPLFTTGGFQLVAAGGKTYLTIWLQRSLFFQ